MWRFFRETPQGLDLDRAKEAWRYLCPKKREAHQILYISDIFKEDGSIVNDIRFLRRKNQ